MLNAYAPPIAVALGCAAPKLSPHEAARLTSRGLAKDQTRGLGLAGIALASPRAGMLNGLKVERKLKGSLISR